jgi:hypothetical protein
VARGLKKIYNNIRVLAAILSAAFATVSVDALGHLAFLSDMDRIRRLEHFHCDVRHWVGLGLMTSLSADPMAVLRCRALRCSS